MKNIIITDMDATFISADDYSFDDSIDAYKRAKENQIPVCFCTSKSFPEIEFFSDILKNRDPFISENGSAVYVPKDYFSFKLKKYNWKKEYKIRNIKEIEDYDIIELNVPHEETYNTLKKIQDRLYFEIKIYTDHTPKELNEYMNIPIDMARRSLKKYYADGCRIPDLTKEKLSAFIKKAKEYGFDTKVGGFFIGINKGCDKGKATEILLELMEAEYTKIFSLGVGDSPNDFPMLKVCNDSFLVQRQDGSYASEKFSHAKGIGPKGWSYAVIKFLKDI
ncbi:MAG: HAD-IIB family hydrolase [Candidatus Woesearchaeota archaeon]